MSETRQIPLVVDLDGTLLNSDLLLESLWALLRQNFFYVFLIPFWLFQGKQILKDEIASRVELDVALLPYNDKVIHYIKEQAGQRRLVLATATNRRLAEKVFYFLGVFDDLLASDRKINLSGETKAAAIESLLDTKDFIYAGNSADDLIVWESCSKAIVVNASQRVLSNLRTKKVKIVQIWEKQRIGVRTLVKALRLHQWTKNSLIFLPLLLSQNFYVVSYLTNAAIAFVAFGLCASSVYLLNDLLDVQDDRVHRSKKFRPIACGSMSLMLATILFPALLCCSIGLAYYFLPVNFFYVLLTYYLATLSYSFYLKRKLLVDVQVLAGLFTLRIIAGGAANSIDLSFWILAFSVFLFFSLALVKRCTELLLLKSEGKSHTKGRGYDVKDLEVLTALGVAAGYISVLVVALFINSNEVIERYSEHEFLWLLMPLMLYWISRIWLVTHRGEMVDDPIVFAIKDKVSIFTALLMASVIILSMGLVI